MSPETATAWLTPEQAGKLLGRSGETIRLWIRHGLRMRGRGVAKRIKLRARRLGAKHQTCQEWIDQFIADCTTVGNGAEVAPAQRVESPDQTRERFAREKEAARKLLNRGVA